MESKLSDVNEEEVIASLTAKVLSLSLSSLTIIIIIAIIVNLTILA